MNQMNNLPNSARIVVKNTICNKYSICQGKICTWLDWISGTYKNGFGGSIKFFFLSIDLVLWQVSWLMRLMWFSNKYGRTLWQHIKLDIVLDLFCLQQVHVDFKLIAIEDLEFIALKQETCILTKRKDGRKSATCYGRFGIWTKLSYVRVQERKSYFGKRIESCYSSKSWRDLLRIFHASSSRRPNAHENSNCWWCRCSRRIVERP